MGARSTPASPAMKLETAQAMAITRPEFTPSSWTSRRLSTAPRICRPRLVKRMRMTRATRTMTVTTTELEIDPVDRRVGHPEVHRVGIEQDAGRVVLVGAAEQHRQEGGNADEQGDAGHQLGRVLVLGILRKR